MARGINGVGQVVGWSNTDNRLLIMPSSRALMVSALETSAHSVETIAMLRDQRRRAGGRGLRSGAFITGPNGVGMRDLGTGAGSVADGINDAGQVVGYSLMTANGHSHAFITGPNGAGMRDLGTLGGDYSYAYGINDAGQVVGDSYTANGQLHAFITGPDGAGMTDLGTLGGNFSAAYGSMTPGRW